MTDPEIDRIVREHGYVLPVSVYISICRSEQVDHVCRDGDWIDIWTRTGGHWRITCCDVATGRSILWL